MASGKPSRIAAMLRISDSVGKAEPGRASPYGLLTISIIVLVTRRHKRLSFKKIMNSDRFDL